MEKVQLRLLGSFQIQAGVETNLRRKNRAILAYLALSPQPLTRHELANLFCQSAADPAHTLRLSLSRLRRALGDAALIDDGETVRLNPAWFQIDVHSFRQRLAQSKLDGISRQQLEEAVALYRGEFLEGLHLPDAPEFEMWLLGQRSQWQQLYERGALAWLKRLIADEQFSTAIPVAQRLVRQNPLLEEAHYHLIWLYARTGQRQAALDQFRQCQAILQAELAVEPTPDLRALQADILAGRIAPARAPKVSSSPAALAPTPAADFVGREAEWQRLNAAWNEVQGEQGRVVLISAEAGGGKTRLAQEWAATLPAGAFLYGPCYESTRALAYHPWLTLLEQIQRRLDPAALESLAAPWLDALSRLLPDIKPQHPSGSGGQQTQLFAAVHAFLGLVNQPLVLFLDDWQWADAASLQLVHFLAERDAPLMLVGAYRSEEAEDNPALLTLLQDLGRRDNIVTLSLAPLSGAAVAQLIRQLWPTLPAGFREPHLRDRLMQATGGNPLFVNEIVRELAGASQLPEELPVPPSLRELIQRRLRQLPASGRQVLETVAVLDQPAGFELTQAISGRSEEETLEALELGLRWRLLVSTTDTPSNLDFNHDLIGQAVRELLSPIRRQLLHRRAAIRLGQRGAEAARLAYHWGKAGDTAQELVHAIQAGHDAAGVYAYQEAISYWQRALALTTDAVQQAALHHHLGRAWMLLGEWDRAEDLYRAGLELAGVQAGGVRAELQAAYGLLLEYKGEYAAALAQEAPALAYFQSVNDRPQIARTLGLIALLHWRQARYDEALDTCRQALADPEALTDPTTHIRLLNISGLILWRQQAYDSALDHLQQAHQMALRHQDRQYEAIVVSNLGNVVQEMGQYEQAIAYYEQALALNRTMKNKPGIAMNLGNLGLMQFYKGDDESALEYGHQALEMDRALGNQESVASHLSNLANSFSRLERHEEAFDYCRQALLIDAGLGNRRGAMIHAGNMSTVYLLWGQAAEALACLTYAIYLDDRLAHSRELARHLTNITAAHLLTGQLAQAERVCRLAMALQQKLAIDFELCWAYLVQGRLFLAQEQFREAVDALERASDAAAASNRSDVQFEAGVLLPRIKWLAGEVNEPGAAMRQLQAMLDVGPTLHQKAAICYERWQLDKNPAHQAQAKAAYEALLQQTPTAEARQRAQMVGVADLPPMPAPPPLPALITEVAIGLDSLLESVRERLGLPA